jgi:hypothetical protein
VARGVGLQISPRPARHNVVVPVTQIKAGLRIGGQHGSVAQISQTLGLTPTSWHDIGDRRSARDPRLWQHMHWALNSGLPDEADLERHLAALCDVLESRTSALEELRRLGFSMDWFCLVGIDGSQGGVILSPGLLKRLGSLPVDLGLDIHTG